MHCGVVGAAAESLSFALFAADLLLAVTKEQGPQKDGGTENDWSVR